MIFLLGILWLSADLPTFPFYTGNFPYFNPFPVFPFSRPVFRLFPVFSRFSALSSSRVSIFSYELRNDQPNQVLYVNITFPAARKWRATNFIKHPEVKSPKVRHFLFNIRKWRFPTIWGQGFTAFFQFDLNRSFSTIVKTRSRSLFVLFAVAV